MVRATLDFYRAAPEEVAGRPALAIFVVTLVVTGAIAYHAAREVRSLVVAILVGSVCVAVSVGVTLWLSGWLS